MEDLSLHILDVAENSIAASARKIEIRIDENQAKDLLTIEIQDDGKGMDEIPSRVKEQGSQRRFV
jgi:sensor histidine kinase YesM